MQAAMKETLADGWRNAARQADIARPRCAQWFGHSFSKKLRASSEPQNWRIIPSVSATDSGTLHGTSFRTSSKTVCRTANLS